MFPAKEAPASRHMLVSRAERGLQATFLNKKSLFSSSSCERACFLQRKLLPVVICLSHGLSEVFRPHSFKKVQKNPCFLQAARMQRNLVDPASSHMLVSWAELFQKKVSGSIPPGSATPKPIRGQAKRNANEQAGASEQARQAGKRGNGEQAGSSKQPKQTAAGRARRKQGGGQAGRQGKQAGRQAGRQASKQAGKQCRGQARGRQAGKQAGRQAGKQAGKQTSRQARRQAGGQAGRQAGKQAR